MRKFIFVCLIGIAFFRALSVIHNPHQGKTVRVSGIITTEPREYSNSLLVSLNNYSFFLNWNPDVLFHSTLVVEGTVNNWELTHVKLVRVEKPTSLLSTVRLRMLRVIHSSLPEPVSSLVSGAVLGAPNIPKDFSQHLKKSGTSHIVVASGGNLAMLAVFLEVLFSRFLKRKVFLPIIALILILYSALTGFGAPIVRALIMWLVILCAQLTGRSIKPLSVLIVTAVFMIIFRPLWAQDVSFYLSVGSTTGILVFTSRIERKLARLPFIKDAVSTSIAAQIGILPVSILVFHEVNLLSPLWNALVLWTIPYITVMGMIGGCVSLLSETLSKSIFTSLYPLGWYFVHIVSLS